MIRSTKASLITLFFVLLFPVFAFAAPMITSITPNTASNWGTVEITDLVGTGFTEGTLVILTKEGQPDIEVPIIVESDTKIKGLLNLMGEAPGFWDVVVSNPDQQISTLTSGFNMTMTPAPIITSNTPDIEENIGYATVELTGDNFLYGAQVKLVRDGYPDVYAISNEVESPTSIICEFNLTNLEAGHYDIVVTNPDGQTGVSNSIDITQAQSSEGFIVTSNADFYVDIVNGNNANDGLTSDTAWRNITYALNTVSGSNIIIHVAAGTYDIASGENFPIVMRDGVSLLGAGPDVTTLDAYYQYAYYATRVVTFSNIGSGEFIDGFTIKNGNTTSIYRRAMGGGINCEHSSPTINNCVIIDNTSGWWGGGGIGCLQSSPTITNCIISGNGAYDNYGHGGGIYCVYSSSPVITNCIITDNLSIFAGGGISSDNGSSPTITNCTISDNSAYGNYYGSGGGGIDCRHNSEVTITNSIVWDNFAYSGSEIHLRRWWWPSDRNYAYVTYSNIKGGWAGEGNIGSDLINHDPLFTEDYFISENSPCIDAGDDTAPNLLLTDIEGDDRILDGNGDDIPRVDMGADEYVIPCDLQGVTGTISPSVSILWPPDHSVVPVSISISDLILHNPDDTPPIKITSVSILETSSEEAGEVYGENIYDPSNFEPDVEITGDLTLNLRRERSGASSGRTYAITVTATDCSGTYTFTTEVVVPHDKR